MPDVDAIRPDASTIARILDRTAATGRRYELGFSYNPTHGHRLALPAEFEPALVGSDHAELRLYGDSRLAFGIAVRLVEGVEATTRWHLVTYVPRRDGARGQVLDVEHPHQVPADSRKIELFIPDGRGGATTVRTTRLTALLVVQVDRRIRLAIGGDSRPGQIEATLRSIGKVDERDVDRLVTGEQAELVLDPIPAASAGAD